MVTQRVLVLASLVLGGSAAAGERAASFIDTEVQKAAFTGDELAASRECLDEARAGARVSEKLDGVDDANLSEWARGRVMDCRARAAARANAGPSWGVRQQAARAREEAAQAQALAEEANALL